MGLRWVTNAALFFSDEGKTYPRFGSVQCRRSVNELGNAVLRREVENLCAYIRGILKR